MKKALKNTLLSAGILMSAGVVLMGAGRLFGSSFQRLWSSGALNIGYWENNTVVMNGPDFQNEYAEDGRYAVSAKGVSSLAVEWTMGEVTVSAHDGEQVEFREESMAGARYGITEDTALRWGVKNGTLYIRFCKNGKTTNVCAKKLEVLLPASLAASLESCELSSSSADIAAAGLKAGALTVDATSGEVNLSDVTAGTLTAGTTSGGVNLPGVTAEELEVGTTSGDVRVSGVFQSVSVESSSGSVTVAQLGKTAADGHIGTTSGSVHLTGTFRELGISTSSGDMDCPGAVSAAFLEADTTSGQITMTGSFERVSASSTSGDVDVVSDICPREADIGTVSGSVRLTLPRDSGFTLETDTVSGDFWSDFSLRMQGRGYIAGSGAAEISIDTTSGDIALFQG